MVCAAAEEAARVDAAVDGAPTTVMGEAAVDLLAAHAGMALLRLMTPCAQVEHPVGFMGVI